MKILVIGSGGREHAIVDAISRSPKAEKIYAAPGNAGIASLAELVAIKDTDVDSIVAFATANAHICRVDNSKEQFKLLITDVTSVEQANALLSQMQQCAI